MGVLTRHGEQRASSALPEGFERECLVYDEGEQPRVWSEGASSVQGTNQRSTYSERHKVIKRAALATCRVRYAATCVGEGVWEADLKERRCATGETSVEVAESFVGW